MQLGEGLNFPKGALQGKGRSIPGREAEGRLWRSQRKCPCELPRARRVPAPHLPPALCTPSSLPCSPASFPLGRTSLTSPSSPAVRDPAHLARPTPQAAAGTGTAVTPARSVASARAGGSSPPHLHRCRPSAARAEEGARAAQGWGEARPRGSRWPRNRASWVLAARRLHEKTQNKARPQKDSAGLMPGLCLGKGPSFSLAVSLAVLVFSRGPPCDTHGWVICLPSGSLEAEPGQQDLGALDHVEGGLAGEREGGREGGGTGPGKEPAGGVRSARDSLQPEPTGAWCPCTAHCVWP